MTTLREEMLSLDEQVLESISPYTKILTIEAVNWTPWWGGDYTGRTVKVRNGRVVGYSLPTVETIKGVMKWVIRAAISCHCKNADYKLLNEILSPIYGGSIKFDDREEHINSLVRIDVEAWLLDKQLDERINQLSQGMQGLWENIMRRVRGNIRERNNKRNVIRRAREMFLNALMCIALSNYACSRNILDINTDCKDVSKIIHSVRLDDPALTKSYGIPRVILALLDLEKPEDAVELLPLPPNTVRVKIDLSINKRLVGVVGVDKARDLAYLSSLALIYALEVVGIGRSPSRGFGRFRIEADKISPGSDELVKDWLSKLKEYARGVLNPKLAKEKIEEIQKELSNKSSVIFQILEVTNPWICKRIAETVSLSTTAEPSSDQTSRYRLPCLTSTQVEVLTNIRHPFPAPIRRLGGMHPKRLPMSKPYVSDIYEALSAIGYATMKALWKAHVISTPMREKKAVAGGISELSGSGFHTWILGLPRCVKKLKTGYAIVKNQELKIDNVCISFEKSQDKDKGRPQVSLEEGRRKSAIIIYPLPDKGSAVLLAFKTYQDHLRILNDLVHVGRHRSREKENPCRHVVAVKHIVSRLEVERGSLVNCRECGPDKPGGVVYPNKEPQIVTDPGVELVEKVYEASIGFIKELLT